MSPKELIRKAVITFVTAVIYKGRIIWISPTEGVLLPPSAGCKLWFETDMNKSISIINYVISDPLTPSLEETLELLDSVATRFGFSRILHFCSGKDYSDGKGSIFMEKGFIKFYDTREDTYCFLWST